MKIKRNNYDPTGASLTKIQINGKTIEGPIRGAPHTDYRHYINGYKDLKLNPSRLHFGEVVRDVDKINLREIASDKEARKELAKRMNRAANPITNQDVIISMPRIGREERVTRGEMRELLFAQIESNPDVVTIPDAKERQFDSDWRRTMEMSILDAQQLQESYDFDTVMPIVSLNQPIDPVVEKTKYLLDLEIDAIGFRYGASCGPRIRRAIPLIREAKDPRINEMWVHFTDVSQKFRSQISQSHLSVLGSFDTISTRKISDKTIRYLKWKEGQDDSASDFEVVKEPDPKTLMQTPPSKPIKKKRRIPKNDLLLPSELLYQSESQHLQVVQQHSSICNCPTHKNFPNYASLSRILNSTERKKYVTLHDLSGSDNEFRIIQKQIANQDLLYYYQQKPIVIKEKDNINNRFGASL